MRKNITLSTASLLMGCSLNAWSFSCVDTTGQVLHSEANSSVVNVYVNLQPNIAVGENLVVDLSSSISCKNDLPAHYRDFASMVVGSAYGGALQNFQGVLEYYGGRYPFPLTAPTANQEFTSSTFIPLTSRLLLKALATPGYTANGVAIKNGDLFASLMMYQVGQVISGPSAGDTHVATFQWNLYANNDVYVPTGTCDVSVRDVTVSLPDFPASASVPITVRCSSNKHIGYYLSGTTDSNNSTFRNSAPYSPAQGIGIQVHRNGSAIPANSTVSLGWVGTSSVDLGLSTTYARTSGQVTAGNVQSLIGVTFVYL